MNQHLQKLIDFFTKEHGKICFYVNSNKTLAEITPLVNRLNCSVLLLCELSIEEKDYELGRNIQVIPIEIITKVAHSNRNTAEKLFPGSYHYYNTAEILLTILKPACVVIPSSSTIQEKIIRTICQGLGILTVNADSMPKQSNEWTEYIRKHISYGNICHYHECKLHIGCAYYVLNDWLNVDINCHNGSYYLDAGREYPFPDKSFEYIYSEHLFEHLTFRQGVTMLKECNRILKDSGSMRIAMPNMEFLMDLYIHPEKEINQKYIKWSINTFLPDIEKLYEGEIYLPEYVINNFFRDWGHQLLHTPREFKILAKKCGFQNVRKCKIGKSDIPIFNNIEQHGSSIPEWANHLETFIYELKK